MLIKDENTISLLHFDDENNLTKDECGNEWVVFKGNPIIKKDELPEFLNSAVYFDGDSQIISNEISDQISDSVYTIEFFALVSQYKSYVHTFFSTINSLASGKNNSWINSSIWNGVFRLCFYGNQFSTSIPLELYKWNHIAITYDFTTYNVFLNGNLCMSGANKGKPSGEFSLGNVQSSDSNSQTKEEFIGYMSEFRISNIIRYFEEFDVEEIIDNSDLQLNFDTKLINLNDDYFTYNNIRSFEFA